MAKDGRSEQKLARFPASATADVHSASGLTSPGQAEVLMIREGTCWVVDDVRYLGAAPSATAGTLRQTLELH